MLLLELAPPAIIAAAADPFPSHFEEQAASAPAEGVRDDRPAQIVVTARRLPLLGEAISASEGVISRDEIGTRPLLRSGDLLEFVPGLIATQHSGSGKANQYFLRGFNLDHGTDFATSVDAMPVNMRTHGHGQGWTDLNFLIPEAVGELRYRKGPYYADVGDFASAGSARFTIADTVERGGAEVTAGSFGYLRAMAIDSIAAGGGDLLLAAELQSFDGPWTDIEENVRKKNLLARYSGPAGSGRAHLMLLAYDNEWNSPDQIPARAVASGLVSPFGSIDTTVGGSASRLSISGGWAGPAMGGTLSLQGYAIDSDLDLFSNFTYFLDDPEEGDQFEQVDQRRLFGGEVLQSWTRGRSKWSAGAEARYDDIGRVGLYRTDARRRHGTVREDGVKEGSLGLFVSNELTLSERLRTYLGLRYDHFRFDVRAKAQPENSGTAKDGKFSFKGSLIYKPASAVELYLSLGEGFHSNDARGTTIRVDPVTGGAADPVDPLVSSRGGELGARLFLAEGLHGTLAAWTLRLNSELLFVGDAGNTEASRPSRRDGVEGGLYYIGHRHLSGQLEVAYTRSRFRDDDPAGSRIPGSIPLVVSGGATFKADRGWLVTGQLRYFGKYPLREDRAVKAGGSLMMNLRAGREWGAAGAYLDVFNLLDRRDHDIDYFYASRLSGEPREGVEDVHYHVLQPRSARVSLRYAF